MSLLHEGINQFTNENNPTYKRIKTDVTFPTHQDIDLLPKR